MKSHEGIVNWIGSITMEKEEVQNNSIDDPISSSKSTIDTIIYTMDTKWSYFQGCTKKDSVNDETSAPMNAHAESIADF